MASAPTQVETQTFPGAGQPVGTGTGQANALLINPAQRALPVVPDIPETLCKTWAGQQSSAESAERARIGIFVGMEVQDEQQRKRTTPSS